MRTMTNIMLNSESNQARCLKKRGVLITIVDVVLISRLLFHVVPSASKKINCTTSILLSEEIESIYTCP